MPQSVLLFGVMEMATLVTTDTRSAVKVQEALRTRCALSASSLCLIRSAWNSHYLWAYWYHQVAAGGGPQEVLQHSVFCCISPWYKIFKVEKVEIWFLWISVWNPIIFSKCEWQKKSTLNHSYVCWNPIEITLLEICFSLTTQYVSME